MNTIVSNVLIVDLVLSNRVHFYSYGTLAYLFPLHAKKKQNPKQTQKQKKLATQLYEYAYYLFQHAI